MGMVILIDILRRYTRFPDWFVEKEAMGMLFQN